MILLSVSNASVSSDNPLVKRPFFTYYLTSSEVEGISHDQNVSTGYMMSDYVPTRYIYFSPNRSQFYVTEVDDVNQTFFRVGSNVYASHQTGRAEQAPAGLLFAVRERPDHSPP